MRRRTAPLLVAALGLGPLVLAAALPACHRQREVAYRPDVGDVRLPSPESDAIRTVGETVLSRGPSTVTSESAGEGRTRVSLTDEGGSRSEVVVESETEFTAQSAGMPLPPGVVKSKGIRLAEGRVSNPLIGMFDVEGMRGAGYTVANTTLDDVMRFYREHNSGRFRNVQDLRSMGLQCVVVEVSGNEDLSIGLVADEKSPANVIIMLLDQSQTKLGSHSPPEVE